MTAMSLRRRVVHLTAGAAVAAGLLAALELGLRLAGVGVADPAGGFDPTRLYLVPSQETPGGWRTTYEGSGMEVPPKTTERWLFVGASTGAGWGSRRLQLTYERATGRKVEVVNLSQAGFGTGRLALIVEQGIRRLDPDLIVIYGGDNEFLEARPSERGLGSEDGSLAGVVRGSRTAQLLTGLLKLRETRLPEPFVVLSPGQRSRLPLEGRQERMEGLRENLRRICTLGREADVEIVLSTLLYNRFAAPYESGIEKHHRPTNPKRYRQLVERIPTLYPDFLRTLVPEDRRDLPRASDWRRWKQRPGAKGPPAEHPPVLPGRRECLPPLAGWVDDPKTMARWGQIIWDFYAALERLNTRDVTEEERAALEEAERLLEAAVELRPTDAQKHFELGLVRYVLGRGAADVAASLELAGDLDRAPRRGSRQVNEVIREVAAEFPEVLLFDADAYFASLSPDGIVGWDWMHDHCHLSVNAYRALYPALIEAIREKRGLPRRD